MYRWIDHTSEVELLVEAEDEPTVFADAVAALAELLDDGGAKGETDVQHLSGGAPDRATMLAELLGEIVFRAEHEGFVPVRLASIDIAGGRFEAAVTGRPGTTSQLVKAVTYHRLSFEPAEGGFRATVVLDV